MQDNMKPNNIHIIGIQEEEEEEQGRKNLLEIVLMENFLNLMREKVTQIQETQRVPIKRNPKRPTSRHIKLKGQNAKIRKNLKDSKRKTVSNIQGSPHKTSS